MVRLVKDNGQQTVFGTTKTRRHEVSQSLSESLCLGALVDPRLRLRLERIESTGIGDNPLLEPLSLEGTKYHKVLVNLCVLVR